MDGKITIPNDWNGTDYCCWVIEWPDSPEWRRVLAGLLLLPSRGRYWDKDTGIITTAQAAGRAIIERNYIYDQECS